MGENGLEVYYSCVHSEPQVKHNGDIEVIFHSPQLVSYRGWSSSWTESTSFYLECFNSYYSWQIGLFNEMPFYTLAELLLEKWCLVDQKKTIGQTVFCFNKLLNSSHLLHAACESLTLSRPCCRAFLFILV